jgi:arginyl-tRNA synthetase
MSETIKNLVMTILTDAGIKGDFELTNPPKPEMGDITLPCFGITKDGSKNPAQVAKDIEARLKDADLGIIEKVIATGPYVNFYVKTSEVAKLVLEEIEKQGKDYGSNKLGSASGRSKKVMIEYPSQNTHKEFHIGHLRNVGIGNTLVNLYEKSGYNVLPVNYVNDFGSHVVKCLWGILKFHNNEEPETNKQKWLGQVYAEASTYVKEHPEVQIEIDELQQKLEARDKSIWPLFERTRTWSIEGFAKLEEELKVPHDKVFYESEVKDRGQEKVDELLKKGIAEVGEGGAIIINLEKYDLDIALLRKSTGSGLYMTSDLALAEKKFKENIEESITITGIEQNFYFKQLFKVLELSGFKNKMTHIGYGLVNLPEGKMSSRSGNVILYEDLRDQIYAHLLKETQQRHPEWSDKQVRETVFKLTMAVLKFTMQKHEAQKNIVFDIKEAVSFEGFSAPYILYVVARITSLIKKSEVKKIKGKIDYSLFSEPEEKKLVLLLAEYPEIIRKALLNYNPSVITKYCFDVAQTFNEFYNKHQVLTVEEQLKNARLRLCDTTKGVLSQALQLLTIETVEEM